jgi:hypothetical protein
MKKKSNNSLVDQTSLDTKRKEEGIAQQASNERMNE